MSIEIEQFAEMAAKRYGDKVIFCAVEIPEEARQGALEDGWTEKMLKELSEYRQVWVVGNKCPECGARLKVRQGKSGAFLGCSAFPKCKFTKNLPGEMIGLGYGHTNANTMTWRRSKGRPYRGS